MRNILLVDFDPGVGKEFRRFPRTVWWQTIDSWVCEKVSKTIYLSYHLSEQFYVGVMSFILLRISAPLYPW
jgi:hypothetical protein